ncbi:hypothetical protein [Pseudogemmobacter humi]|uniref:hypothetical protein n=1 Tax=Pseudogemmobacter humi TaxID=2483812 RepID=UPI000F524929|nr:hypothetical protein [Pseudogemmobacter humi]
MARVVQGDPTSYTRAELAAFAVPELQRLARSGKATLAAHGFTESERFALNRLAWPLPKLVQMEASPKKLPPILGGPTLPTPRIWKCCAG